jgi:hypothetical protein
MAQSDFVNYCEAKHQRTNINANYCEARHYRSHDHPTFVVEKMNPCLVFVLLFDCLLRKFVEKLSIVSSNKIIHQAPYGNTTPPYHSASSDIESLLAVKLSVNRNLYCIYVHS